MNWVLVFFGGGLGSLLRYGIGLWLYNEGRAGFPYPTFIANVLSCLIAGLLIGYFSKYTDNTESRLLLLTGFCGGFSTFSTFSVESLLLIQRQEWTTAIIYIASTVVICLAAVGLGFMLMHK